MAIRELDYPYAAATPQLAWRAIFAGALVCLAVGSALTSLGLGTHALRLGGRAVLSLRDASALAWLWMLAACAIAFYAGGWTAGRAAGAGRRSDSVLHGAAAWALALLALPLPTWAFLSFAGVQAVRGQIALGWLGFAVAAVGCAASCAGAWAGARLRFPVSIEAYRGRHEAARGVASGTSTPPR